MPPDPRLTYSGPFQNVGPEVGHVGDGKCAECHFDIALTYFEHPMGRSTVAIADLASQQKYGTEQNLPFDKKGLRFWVDREGDRVWHRHARLDGDQPLYEVRDEVHYAVGSGTRGFSYLTVRDGFLFQTPISWYSQKKIWDLSPSFRDVPAQGRPIPTECMQCHVNRLKTLPDQIDRFAPGIFEGLNVGCERCHGPGEKHVARHERGEPHPTGQPDFSIVNPARLPPDLRENVCEQCHVNGEVRVLRRGRDWFDFRPGLPLDDFFTVFVRNSTASGENLAVGQVEQMRRSACFLKSDGAKKMGCISCHDPHVHVSGPRTADYYRQRCLSCHEQKGCSEPRPQRLAKQPDDSCIACHMPRGSTSDIAHTALTDHSIPRRPGTVRPVPRLPGAPPLLALDQARFKASDPERQRDLAVALARVSDRTGSTNLTQAGLLLEESLKHGPTDPDGWWALGVIRMDERRLDDAVAALERARALAPRRDRLLGLLAFLEQDRKNFDRSLDYFRQAAAVNPYVPHYHAGASDLLYSRGNWSAAAEEAREWVRLDPGNAEARFMLVRCLVEMKQTNEAARLFREVRRLNPSNLPRMEAWYRKRAG
ncbi:MAG: tetratricopeptide repeat protein [Gemmataceae bacterium]